MLVVTIEMHSAITHQKTVLGRAIIANTGTTTNPRRGDYIIHVGRKSCLEPLNRIFGAPLRLGTVKNYPRLSYNVWRLVLRALASAFPEEHIKFPDIDSIEFEEHTETGA